MAERPRPARRAPTPPPSHELEAALERERAANQRLREAAVRQLEYLSTASHELRTPLAAIVGFVKTLRQPGFGEDPELREELLARSERQGERLMRMIEHLLSSSALEGGLEPTLEPVDLVEVVAEIVESMPEGSVAVDVPRGARRVVADREKLGVILANLIGNAIRFSPRTRSCRVRARQEEGSLRLWVEDDGIGMTPEELAHAFEPFFQGREEASPGVGLGLYVVRRLVDLLEGDVLAQSAPGAGTTFEITLPQPHAIAERRRAAG